MNPNELAYNGSSAGKPACDRRGEPDAVDRCVDELPELEREIVVSYCFVNKTEQEIAERIGITPAAIKSRLDRALESLRCTFVKRGLVAPGIIAATFLKDMNAATPIPSELAHSLAQLDPSTIMSAKVSSGALAGARSNAHMTAWIASAIAVVAAAAISWPLIAGGSGRATTSASSAAAGINAMGQRYQRRWSFDSGNTGGLEPRFGQWRHVSADEHGVAGMTALPAPAGFSDFAVIRLPDTLPDRPILATVRTYLDSNPGHKSASFAWFDENSANAIAKSVEWQADAQGVELGRVYEMRCYLTRESCVTVFRGKIIGCHQYAPDPARKNLLFIFGGGQAVQSIELTELAPGQVPLQVRDPEAVIRENNMVRAEFSPPVVPTHLFK
jgi:hypothetical protein